MTMININEMSVCVKTALQIKTLPYELKYKYINFNIIKNNKNEALTMNGNIKIKATTKQAKKIINILGFVESQMELLVEKLDEIDLNSESDEVINMLNQYSDFNERVTKELNIIIKDDDK